MKTNKMETIKILHFDDEKWMAETLRNNLLETYPQYQIKLVNTIESFLEELESAKRYHIIILDIMSPMSLIIDNEKIRNQFNSTEIQTMADGSNVGEILYRKVRKSKGYSLTPILFYSAKRMPPIQGDHTAFLRKPEFVEAIHEKIQQMIIKQ